MPLVAHDGIPSTIAISHLIFDGPSISVLFCSSLSCSPGTCMHSTAPTPSTQTLFRVQQPKEVSRSKQAFHTGMGA